ncbi:MAG: XRE family transcriptional regulator [Arcobacter sp.]|nr:MAG: XRE family transcriptional regulator [Arcobacter sp.]
MNIGIVANICNIVNKKTHKIAIRFQVIGNRIKECRESAGFTQDEFCIKIEKSKSTLLNYEKNESDPSVKTAILIAEICDVDKMWLLTGDKEECNINYKDEIIKTLENLNENDLKSVYHFAKSKEN